MNQKKAVTFLTFQSILIEKEYHFNINLISILKINCFIFYFFS